MPAGVAGSIAVISSDYSDGSKVVTLDARDNEGNSVIAVVLLKNDGNSVLLSVHGKRAGWQWIVDQINNSIEHNERVYLREGLRGETASPVSIQGSVGDGTPSPEHTAGNHFNASILVRHKSVLKPVLEPSCLCRLSGRNGGQFMLVT